MTTPTTPAGWYPDPDGSGGQRYWDGSIWTEHRAPAVAAPEPAAEPPASEQATSVVSLPDQPTTVVPTGAHRAPDAEPEPVSPPAAPASYETPSSGTPPFETPPYEPPTFETPSFEATAAAATAASTPPSEPPTFEAPSYEAPSFDAPAAEAPSSYEAPKFETPSYEAPSFGAPSSAAPSSYDAPTSYETPSFDAPSYEAPSYEAPPATAAFAGADGTGGPPNKSKVLTGYLIGVGVLFLALILAAVYGFVIRDNTPPQLATPSTSASATASSESSTTETSSESPTTTPGLGGEATDGDFAFSVASTDSGDTITSPIDDSVVKTANGEYFVVYVNVGNNGASPLTWLSVLQTVSDGTTTYTPDVEASAALTGDVITINPGEQLEVALAFDVPIGTVPTTIQLHGDPGSPGVELPV